MGNHKELSTGVSGDVSTKAALVQAVTVVTHNGVFQADDVFSVTAMEILNPRMRLVRTRDADAIKAADVVIDVGGIYDPDANRFDHHQPGRAGARPNGILYSAFGLVWKEYGKRTCFLLGVDPDQVEAVALEVDRSLVQGIDALDNGQSECLGTRGLVDPVSISGAISSLNPTWCEPNDPQAFDNAFWLATSMARLVLERAVASAYAKVRAREGVLKAIWTAKGSQIIVLDQGGMPWQEIVHEHAPKALFVVFQSPEGTWMVQCVPDALGSFGKRKELPVEWAGLRDAEFQAKTGVKSGVFCHPGQFICGATTQEGAMELALLAVQD